MEIYLFTSIVFISDEKSSAAYLDNAVFLNVAREKEDEQRVAKQTIRIKAPVTSEILQNKLSNLKMVDNSGTEHQRTVCFYDFQISLQAAFFSRNLRL